MADADVFGFVDDLRRLTSLLPHLTVIVLVEETDPEWRKSLEAAGAADVIAKHAEVEEIEQALVAAIDRRLAWSRLTAREIEILDLVARGGSNREVGAALWLSDQTVKFHLANVYRKLGVASRAAAVALGSGSGGAPCADLRRPGRRRRPYGSSGGSLGVRTAAHCPRGPASIGRPVRGRGVRGS